MAKHGVITNIYTVLNGHVCGRSCMGQLCSIQRPTTLLLVLKGLYERCKTVSYSTRHAPQNISLLLLAPTYIDPC